MEKENKFLKPEVEIILFSTDDIILTSVIGDVGEDDPIEH